MPLSPLLEVDFFFIQYILMKKLISGAVLKQLMEEVCLMLCGSLFQTAGPCISCKVVKLKLKNIKQLLTLLLSLTFSTNSVVSAPFRFIFKQRGPDMVMVRNSHAGVGEGLRQTNTLNQYMKNTYSDTKTYVTDKEVDKKLMSNMKDQNLFHFFGRETQSLMAVQDKT